MSGSIIKIHKDFGTIETIDGRRYYFDSTLLKDADYTPKLNDVVLFNETIFSTGRRVARNVQLVKR